MREVRLDELEGNVAGAAVQGKRAFTMDLPEFVALLDFQKILGEGLTREQATDIFWTQKGCGSLQARSKARDREIDLHEFVECCWTIAAHLGVPLAHIARQGAVAAGRAAAAAAAAGQGGEAAGGGGGGQYAEEFPLHSAAADGDLARFDAHWVRLKAIEDKLQAQQSGAGRDLVYLATLLLKRRKQHEFRIFKGAKPPPPPLWAQSASNLGVENAVDHGGWTCLCVDI